VKARLRGGGNGLAAIGRVEYEIIRSSVSIFIVQGGVRNVILALFSAMFSVWLSGWYGI